MVLESGVTYEWFAIHVSRVSCRMARDVLRSYFSGAARPAGPVPRDGTFVLGWLCHTGPAVPHGGTSARCARHRAMITARWTARASAKTQVSVNAGGAILAVKPARIHLVSNENLASCSGHHGEGRSRMPREPTMPTRRHPDTLQPIRCRSN